MQPLSSIWNRSREVFTAEEAQVVETTDGAPVAARAKCGSADTQWDRELLGRELLGFVNP